MNGCCDTKVKQVLDAIEHGTLPPIETVQRLTAIIEYEIGKEHEAADMDLISVAQDLLRELHLQGAESDNDERRIDQLRRRIDATVERQNAQALRASRAAKIIVAIAAVVILIVGVGKPMQWSWFESWSTPDEQQFVIQRNEITADVVSRAIAERNRTGKYYVSDVSEFDEYMGCTLGIPQSIDERWYAEKGTIQFFPKEVTIVVQYIDCSEEQKYFVCLIDYYTDPDAAWFVFEQSAHGVHMCVDNHDVYISENVNDTTVVFCDGITLFHIEGKLDEKEAVRVVQRMIGE